MGLLSLPVAKACSIARIAVVIARAERRKTLLLPRESGSEKTAGPNQPLAAASETKRQLLLPW